MWEIAIGNRCAVAECSGEISEPGSQDDCGLRQLARSTADCVRRRLDLVVVGHQSRKPAIVAVMKLASVPANIARSPRRARSCRRFGASPPMPPICIPMELKLAK